MRKRRSRFVAPVIALLLVGCSATDFDLKMKDPKIIIPSGIPTGIPTGNNDKDPSSIKHT